MEVEREKRTRQRGQPPRTLGEMMIMEQGRAERLNTFLKNNYIRIIVEVSKSSVPRSPNKDWRCHE